LLEHGAGNITFHCDGHLSACDCIEAAWLPLVLMDSSTK
jgi:hypothetical protein